MVKCAEGARTISAGLTFLMAFACGAMVANLYYAQTLIDQIGPEIGLSKGRRGALGSGLAMDTNREAQTSCFGFKVSAPARHQSEDSSR
jgi:hypothetical protein